MIPLSRAVLSKLALIAWKPTTFKVIYVAKEMGNQPEGRIDGIIK